MSLSMLRTKAERLRFGKDLKDYRAHMLLTQADLAALLGLKKLAVARFETGVMGPSRETARKFYELQSRVIKSAMVSRAG